MAKKKKYNSADSPIWKVIGIAGNSIMMNLLYIVFCIPVITIGPATCGLYTAVRYFIRGDSWIDGFFKGFKNNVWRVIGVWTVSLAAIFFVANDIMITVNNYEKKYLASLIISSVILALILSFISTFLVYNVYFPSKLIDLLTETAAFVFKAPLQVLCTAVLMWLPVLLFFFGLSGIIFEFVLIFIALYFSVCAFASTLLLKNPLIKVLNAKREAGEEIIK